MSNPRTLSFANPDRKPARLTFAVAGATVAAAALAAVGVATATPGTAGSAAALGTALASHSSSRTLPLDHLTVDRAGGTGGQASPQQAGGLPVTAHGLAILASGRAAAAAAARPGRSAPPARPANPAPVKADASSARPVRHQRLDRSARNGHRAVRARPAHASPRRAGPCASSALHRWICHAETVLERHGVSRGRLSTSAALIVVQHESGGNPGAYNGWDSNAAAGHPSEGIAQVIGPTFKAYALPGYGNIWNPVDNMIAAFRYAISRYGSMNNIPGVVSVRQGGSYMGY